MARKKTQDDALAELLAAVPSKILVDLLIRLAVTRPDVRRECFDYLNKHIPLSNKRKNQSEGEIVLALWSELEPNLSELDEYGGGDYDAVDDVAGLLYEIEQRLSKNKIDAGYRRALLNEVLPYIESGNAGLDDPLYDLAYATCYDERDLRFLAEAFEAMGGDWKIEHARRIYRQLGDRDKYLDLRERRMVYGADYYDLASFYWKAGDKKKAVQVAEQGLASGKGRMDDLRKFLAQRAKDSGDRESYLELQFAQTVDHLACDKYKAFHKLCTKAEWKVYEPKILARLKDAWPSEQLRIRMHRKEYDKAVTILVEEGYPSIAWDSDYEIQTAKRLEQRFPEEILKYYLSGLGNLRANAVRKEYARRAHVMAKVRRLLVVVMKDKERWLAFSGKVKRDNVNRPAFQDEFAKAVPGWGELR
ncbi:hypothetical protein ACFL1S_03020 [Pseudomonadota bacterium]